MAGNANLEKIIKLTQSQYDTLASGGTVGGYTGLNDNYLYLIQDNTEYQPLDADLTAIANLSSTGYLKRTGNNTWVLDANAYLRDYGTNPQSSGGTITQPGGSNAVSMRSSSTSGRDVGIFRLSDDNAYVCNSSDSNYLFGAFDTDKTLDFSSAENAAFVVLSDHAGVKMKGDLTVAGSISEGGTALSSKYLGISAKASDADKLDGNDSTYYLNYNNLTNKPTMPTVNNGTLSIQGNGTTASSFTANQSGNTTLNIKGSGGTTVTKSADNEITISTGSIPTVNNGTLTIQKNGTNVATFTANASSNVTANITVPTNSDYVDLTTDQTVAGSKKFRSSLKVDSYGNSSSTDDYIFSQYSGNGMQIDHGGSGTGVALSVSYNYGPQLSTWDYNASTKTRSNYRTIYIPQKSGTLAVLGDDDGLDIGGQYVGAYYGRNGLSIHSGGSQQGLLLGVSYQYGTRLQTFDYNGDTGQSSNWHTIDIPHKDGTLALLEDIPSVLGTGASNKNKFLHTNSSTGALEWSTPTDTNYYPTRSYSSGLQISTSTNVTNTCALYVPDATTSQKGVLALTKDNLNTMINQLDTGSSTPVDADYYVSQYVGGGTTTTTFHRRPMSALWSYIKGKSDTTYIAKTLTSAKGDIIYASAANTPARLAIGSSGQVLKVNSSGVPAWSTDNNDNYYPIRSYTSGLQISSYSGSTNCQLYVPNATASQAGVVTTAAQTFGGTKTFSSINVADSNSHSFNITPVVIDSTLNIDELEVKSNRDTYTLFTVKAPDTTPKEATLTLKVDNTGTSSNQAYFMDITAMNYRNGDEEPEESIYIQSRNADIKPNFNIGYTDETQTRHKKFIIKHDALPIMLTSTGVWIKNTNSKSTHGWADRTELSLAELQQIKNISSKVDTQSDTSAPHLYAYGKFDNSTINHLDIATTYTEFNNANNYGRIPNVASLKESVVRLEPDGASQNYDNGVYQIYGHMPLSAAQARHSMEYCFNVSNVPNATYIPQYNEAGRLQSNTPYFDDDVSTKGYVDGKFVGKTGTEDITGQKYIKDIGLGFVKTVNGNRVDTILKGGEVSGRLEIKGYGYGTGIDFICDQNEIVGTLRWSQGNEAMVFEYPDDTGCVQFPYVGDASDPETLAVKSDIKTALTPTAVGTTTTVADVGSTGYSGARFTVGTTASARNGLYIFTYGNCMIMLPIYNVTAGTEYRTSAAIVDSQGSYATRVLTYRVNSSGYLDIYQKQNYIPTGYGAALFKIKLY